MPRAFSHLLYRSDPFSFVPAPLFITHAVPCVLHLKRRQVDIERSTSASRNRNSIALKTLGRNHAPSVVLTFRSPAILRGECGRIGTTCGSQVISSWITPPQAPGDFRAGHMR